MSVSNFEQGTPEWHALRCGKVTASRIADVMRTGRSGQPSASRARYMGELITERLTGQPTTGYKSADMEWGSDTEEEARNAYAFLHAQEPLHPVAFVDHPTIAMAGASPDRLVGDTGLVEIKCPASHTHIETLLGAPIPADYIKQMQWQMACTGRKWCDFVSYDPRMPDHMRLYVKRVPYSAGDVDLITSCVTEFQRELDAKLDQLRTLYADAA